MPQSLHILTAHIVFSTKHRVRNLNPALRPKLWAYLAGILQNLECQAVTVGGFDDHVHILCNMTKKHATMKIMEIVKKESSKWIKQQDPGLADFH